MPPKNNSKGTIAGMHWSLWITYTLIYATGLAIVSGIAMVYLPAVIYLGGVVPMDVQNWIWILGIAMWGVCTAKMFKRKSEE